MRLRRPASSLDVPSTVGRAGFWRKIPASPAPSQSHRMGHPVRSTRSLMQDAGQMKACLSAGYPFVFGFTVYKSFEGDAVAKSGMVPMPGASETEVGGHAVMAVGYNDSVQRFLVRNSWGSGWGVGGYFTIPYA